jgi:predicted DNA-binding protein YlxM (UPF0122 family)
VEIYEEPVTALSSETIELYKSDLSMTEISFQSGIKINSILKANKQHNQNSNNKEQFSMRCWKRSLENRFKLVKIYS